MKIPSVTFNIATYNDLTRLKICLKHIKNLEYPKFKIKINIIDGGSSDATKDYVKQKKIKFINNPHKLPEPALSIGYLNSDTDLAVYMATDNIIFDKLWLIKMVKPFMDKDIQVAFSKVSIDKKDFFWSNYLNTYTDPFNSFIFGNACHPDLFKKKYNLNYKGENFYVYDYDYINYPLIAFAQCTIVRNGLARENIHDDIFDLINYIKLNHKIAYVYNTSIYHHSLRGFKDFIKKFDFRIRISLEKNLFTERSKISSISRKFKKYLFPLYAISPLPILKSFKELIVNKNIYYIVHPLACITILILIIKNLCQIKIKN